MRPEGVFAEPLVFVTLRLVGVRCFALALAFALASDSALDAAAAAAEAAVDPEEEEEEAAAAEPELAAADSADSKLVLRTEEETEAPLTWWATLAPEDAGDGAGDGESPSSAAAVVLLDSCSGDPRLFLFEGGKGELVEPPDDAAPCDSEEEGEDELPTPLPPASRARR